MQWPYLFFSPAGRRLHRGPGRKPERGGKRAAALNQADGTFVVPGPDGRAIPPGQYRVSVTQKYRTRHSVDKPKKLGTAPIDRDTALPGERYRPTASLLVVEMTASEKRTLDQERAPGSTGP